MSDTTGMRIRWAIWGSTLALWTFALLTPFPIQASHEVLPPEAQYPSAKSLHVGIYAGLVVLTAWLSAGPRVRPWLLGLLLVHGPLTEFLQNYVPMRTGTVTDVAYDLIGVGVGLILTWRSWLTPIEETEPALEPSALKHPSYYTAPADRKRSA